jgi:hypothetical protein
MHLKPIYTTALLCSPKKHTPAGFELRVSDPPADTASEKLLFLFLARMPDFSRYYIPKREKVDQIIT